MRGMSGRICPREPDLAARRSQNSQAGKAALQTRCPDAFVADDLSESSRSLAFLLLFIRPILTDLARRQRPGDECCTCSIQWTRLEPGTRAPPNHVDGGSVFSP